MYHVKQKIADFDASSLYPSAAYHMERFLEGLPKVFKNIYYDSLKE